MIFFNNLVSKNLITKIQFNKKGNNELKTTVTLKVIPMSLLVNLHKISAMILLLKTFQQKETFNSFMLLEKHYFVTEETCLVSTCKFV